MYRRPLAGVFDFGFCARAKRSKVKGAGRRPAVQKAQAKRTLARVRKASANVLWRYVGTGVIFTCRLLADASATERRASSERRRAMICRLSRNPCAFMRIQTHETQGFIRALENSSRIELEFLRQRGSQ